MYKFKKYQRKLVNHYIMYFISRALCRFRWPSPITRPHGFVIVYRGVQVISCANFLIITNLLVTIILIQRPSFV